MQCDSKQIFNNLHRGQKQNKQAKLCPICKNGDSTLSQHRTTEESRSFSKEIIS